MSLRVSIDGRPASVSMFFKGVVRKALRLDLTAA